MKRQKGLSLTGMVLILAVVFMLLLLAFKIIPVYTDYFAIKNHFKAMSMDPKLASGNRGLVTGAWAARASVDNLHSLNPDLIEVSKEGGGIVISADYSVKVPLFRNVAACFDFHADSR